MGFFRNLSIKSKLTTIHILVVLLTLGGGFSFVIINDLRTFKENMVESNITIAQTIGDYTVSELAFGDQTEATRTLSRLSNLKDIELACLYDKKGDPFAIYGPNQSKPIAPAVRKEFVKFYKGSLHIYRPIYYDGLFYGTFYLQISTGSLKEKTNQYLTTMSLLMAGLFILALMLVNRLQRLISGPIEALTTTAKSITKEPDYSIRAKKNGEDEIGLLCDAFNNMLDQIEQRISERNHAAKALQTSEEQYRELVDNMLDVVYALDNRGNIIFTSPSLETLAGYKPSELEGKRMIDFVHPEDKSRMESLIHEMGKGDQPPTEFRVITKSGEVKWVKASSRLRMHEGNQVGITGSLTDITESKRLQAQLQQAQKMEAIGTLAGGIAHDFNNILTAIIGYTELSLLDVDGIPRARSNLEQVQEAGSRAKALVTQILAFSRQSPQERKPIILQAIVYEALSFLKATLSSTIKIVQDIQDEPATIMADSTQIHQVLMNLCTNSAYAMTGKGGTLYVGVTTERIGQEATIQEPGLEPGPYVKITVRDTGEGMDEAILEKIFDPFFTTKKPGAGTGMGLSVVHGIVKSHEGSIKVSSEPGQGSEFRILLPMLPSQVPAESIRARPLPRGHGRVLFVDDEPPLAELVEQMLKHLGYEPVVKTNCEEALELFQQAPKTFDVIVTDMSMPNMTGVKLAAELVRIRSDIPIILCTGFSEAISQDTIRRAGIREVLMKPLAIRDLGHCLRRAMGVENG